MNDKEIEKGYYMIIGNAESLIEEAELLLKHEFFARAYTLGQLAVEEVGKCTLLHRALIKFYHGDTIDARYLNAMGFLAHKAKTKASLIGEIIAIDSFEETTGQKTDLGAVVIKDFEQLNQLNDLKNNSLYVSVQNDEFISPSETITQKMAVDILIKSKIRLSAEKPLMQSLEDMKMRAEAVMEVDRDPQRKKEIIQKIKDRFGIVI